MSSRMPPLFIESQEELHRPTAGELYQSVTVFSQKQFVEEQGFGATANAFTLKSVIEEVGPFDDRVRNGGDYEWGQRVLSSAYATP